MSKLGCSYLHVRARAGWWLVSSLIGSLQRKSTRTPEPEAAPGLRALFTGQRQLKEARTSPSPLLSSSIQDGEWIHFGFSSPGSPSVCLHILQVLALAFNCSPWNKRGKNRLWLKKSKWLILCVCYKNAPTTTKKSLLCPPPYSRRIIKKLYIFAVGIQR